MKARNLFIFITALALTSLLHGQDQQPGGTADVVNTNQGMTLPPPVSGQGATLGFAPELARSNFLSGGLTLGSTFDDNVLNSGSNRLSNFAYSVSPYIALNESRERLSWNLDYAGGFTANQRYSALNQGFHNFAGQTTYRLAPHANLRLLDTFSMSTGFFNSLMRSPSTPVPGILEGPNQSVITPLAKQTGNTSSAELDYQFTAHSMIGATGGYYSVHYRDAPMGTALIDSHSVAGQGFYNYRLSNRNLLGLSYRFQKLTFSPAIDNALVHTLLITYTAQIRPTVSLSVFAGPQYSNAKFDLPVELPNGTALLSMSQRTLSGSGGATFTWNGQRTSLTANVLREISDGAGLLGAVQSNMADISLRRQLTRTWGASFGATYATNRSLVDVYTLASKLKTTTGSFALERMLGSSIAMRLGYARNYQQEYSGPISGKINHNRAWVSLSYSFSRPLGR